jgi:hypothetical protein
MGENKRRLVNVGKDLNHFDPDYFGDGKVWIPYDVKPVERAFTLARNAYWNSGREIYNASTKTKLSEKILPRINFEDVIK